MKKKWENLTSGTEFETVTKYIYKGDTKLQIYHSYHHFNEQEKMSYSNNYCSDSCDPVKQKNYIGYSLQKTFYSERNDGHLCSFGVTPSGDTSDISEFIRVEGKHSFESWSRQEIRSDEYQYSMSDTISKRQGYTINYATYRLSEE